MNTLACIRVAIVEDDVEYLNFVSEVIQAQPDMHLSAAVTTLADGLALLKATEMDVLLVDLMLPDGSGIELIREATALRPECEVLVSTIFGDDRSAIRAFEAGATGYLLKQEDGALLANDIRNLHAGGSPISPLIARKMLARLRPGGFSDSSPGAFLDDASVTQHREGLLSERELQVLSYVTKGFTSEEIANLMGVSRHTVLTYVRRTYRKLNVNSKAEAIFEARLHGLIP